MSSSASIVKKVQPQDVTAWTYDIEMQMLKENILKLKKNLTEANANQVKENEEAIAEKKIALEKHCRQFGMRYGKWGTEESEVKLEDVNDEMTNGDVKMNGDSTTGPTDVAASATVDGIRSPQSPIVHAHDSNGVVESIEHHEETSMAVSPHVPSGIEDPFITPAGHIAPANLFHAPTGTFQNDCSLDTYNGGYAPDFNTNDPLSGQTAQPAVDIDKFLDDQEANYTTSAGHGDDAGMDFGGGDDEMDMDTVISQTPVAELEEPVIPGMEKYDNL
ncbi:hypothetical protein KCU81_g2967, partial [Aureobasidium melanogenum]|uniref:Uncharacterized protein n=1 Tax=Aureobasidium melanogenum (strain CBS 110374) TaxID=1043003 RepID=A0A074VDJ0_AURM1